MKHRKQWKVEDWDRLSDERYLESLAEAVALAEIKQQAIETAFQSHPVAEFVLKSKIEGFETYPAISDSREDSVYIEWLLAGNGEPGSSCGFVSTSSDYVSCTEDAKHFSKARRLHCWMMGCPNCFNDAALRRASQYDRKINAVSDISVRTGFDEILLKHWVISPEQEYAKRAFRTLGRYEKLRKDMIETFQFCGAECGVYVVHPWRLQRIDENMESVPENNEWVVGPHWHVLSYGHVDTDRFRRMLPGWVVKQIHAKEKIRSVLQTLAYLLTHTGIPRFEKNPTEVDRWHKELTLFVPDYPNGYRLEDMEKEDLGKYSYEGLSRKFWSWWGDDIDHVDWERFEMELRSGTQILVKTFGDLNSRKMRKLGQLHDEVRRTCPECLAPMDVMNNGEHVCEATYNREVPYFCRVEDMEKVIGFYDDMKDKYGVSFEEYANLVPQISSGFSQGRDEPSDSLKVFEFNESVRRSVG